MRSVFQITYKGYGYITVKASVQIIIITRKA